MVELTHADLMASEELNRRLLEAVPGGVVHVRVDGAILRANTEAQGFLGYAYDQLTGRYTSDWEPETLWEDGSPCLPADYPVTLAMTTGAPAGPATIGVRRPDGSVRWAVFRAMPVLGPEGQVAGALVTFLDITERVAMASRLRESEALLASFLASAPNVLLATDADGIVLFANQATVRDAAPTDLVGLHLSALVAPAYRSVVLEAMAQAAESGQPAPFEAPAHPDLDPGWYEAQLGPVLQHGALHGFTLVARDVRELRDLYGRLAISERMASVGTLAAGVAHEINNPLTYVLSNLVLVERALRSLSHPVAEQSVGRLENAIEGAERIRRVVADLSAFANVAPRGSSRSDLAEVLESSLRMATSQLRFRAQVVRRYDPVPQVVGDAGRLGQVFLNLLVNAGQAMPEGKVDEHNIVVSTRQVDDAVEVEIRDDGTGIPPEILERVTDPFVTTKPPGHGTGLGLFVCRNILSELGGTLVITSTEGEGTTVRVRLPIAGHTIEAGDVDSASDLPTVLVVDDEEGIRDILREALGAMGFSVQLASSGREALERLAAGPVDVVLCDLIMAEMDGVEVYERLDPHLSERMVFMTGGAFTTRAKDFLDGVNNPVMLKPFDVREVARVLTSVVERT